MSDPDRKAKIDALLLKLPGVVSKKLNQLDAYFVNDRMFACIADKGVALRLPSAKVTDLQFSRSDVGPFAAGGLGAAATWAWVQIDRQDATDYAKDLELFQAALEFVKAGKGR
jgi:hypothetical protein